jgi:hypothetical protein
MTYFQAFFNYPGMAELLPSFCVFHVNAPGMEEGAEKLPEEFAYPSMDELAEQVCSYFSGFISLIMVILRPEVRGLDYSLYL